MSSVRISRLSFSHGSSIESCDKLMKGHLIFAFYVWWMKCFPLQCLSVTSKWNILKEQCFTRWLEKQVRSYMLHYFKIKLELALFRNSQLKWRFLKWNLNTILHENKTQVPLPKIKNISLLKSTTSFHLHINLS